MRVGLTRSSRNEIAPDLYERFDDFSGVGHGAGLAARLPKKEKDRTNAFYKQGLGRKSR
jgi:hypothetical protein